MAFILNYKNRPLCCVEGCQAPANIVQRVRHKNKTKVYYRKECAMHHLHKKHPYKRYRKSYCENRDGRLGFKCRATNLQSFQLDVDHINGNHHDNRLENLQTLCANCHRYKTKMSGDTKKGRGKAKRIISRDALKLQSSRNRYVAQTAIVYSLSHYYDDLVVMYRKAFGKKTQLPANQEAMVLAMRQTWQQDAQDMTLAELNVEHRQYYHWRKEMREECEV